MKLKAKSYVKFLMCLAVAFATMGAAPASAGYSKDAGKSIRINPQMKINRFSNGSVVVTSRNPQEASVRHEFTDFYADLLMAAYRKHPMNIITDTLKKKYYLSEEECRREIKHAVNILSEWKILLRDEDLSSR